MNRILIVLVILIAFVFTATAQYKIQTPEQKNALYKVERYGKLKRTGFTLLGTGAAVSLIGIAMMASTKWVQDPITGQIEPENPSGILGLVGTIYIGIPLIATGTVLAIVGNKKEKSYMRRYDRLNASYIQKGDFKGISLTYNF